MSEATKFEQEIAALKAEGASDKEAIAELTKTVDTLTKSLDKPDFSGLRAHAGEGTMGYWETDKPEIVKTRVRPDGKYRALPKSMPKGYKNEAFGSGSEFFGQLIKGYQGNDGGEFQRKYSSTVEPIQKAAQGDRGLAKAIQGMSTQVGSEGGVWILPEFSQQIIDHVYSNDIWQRTDGYTVAGNNLTFKANAETSRANGSRHGGLRGYWTAEGGSITSSLPRTRDVALRLNKLAVLVYLTDELIEDGGPALEQYITRKASEEFEFMLGDAVFNGSGVGQPLGILNAPGTLSISKETGQLASTIVTENLDAMWARRMMGGSYAWYHNQDCNPQLDQLAQDVGTGGIVLNRPGGSITTAPAQGLKGAPRVETEFNATLGTVGDIVLSDLGEYITISKGGIAQAVSIHVQFVTDQTALRFTMRVDGRPPHVSAITPYKGSNTQAYHLSLATRS